MWADRILVLIIVGVFLVSQSSFASADSFTLDTVPSGGTISGSAGSTIGWGYSITNQSQTNWLVTSILNSDLFLNGRPVSIFDFPLVAPGQTVSMAFDPLNNLGLFELKWDTAAPVGFLNTGSFVLGAEWWT